MNDPVTMRRQLVAELRRLRATKGLTQRQVAERLDWSPSKIIRIEKAIVGITVTDLQALLRLYDIDDETVTSGLANMARNSKRLPFNEYRDYFSADTLRYFRYESSASIIRQFEQIAVPGVLQTEEYGRSLLHEIGNSSDRVETIWSSRADRQELLERDDHPEMFFILGEAVVRQNVGGNGVMRQQRERLIALNARPRISIQILPFSAPAHVGMLGPFTYLGFDAAGDPDVLYAEGTLGDAVIRDDDDVTTRYLEYFFDLEKLALPPERLESFLSTHSQ